MAQRNNKLFGSNYVSCHKCRHNAECRELQARGPVLCEYDYDELGIDITQPIHEDRWLSATHEPITHRGYEWETELDA